MSHQKISFAKQSDITLKFVLPLSLNRHGKKAAQSLLEKMGLENIDFIQAEEIGLGNTLFEVTARSSLEVNAPDFSNTDLPKISVDFDQINQFIHKHIGRKIKVFGVCLGKEEHTISLDILFNKRGYWDDFGFENYNMLESSYMRASEDLADIIARLKKYEADVIVVSCSKTQDNQHLQELKDFCLALQNEPELTPHLLKICVGPKLTEEVLAFGYDGYFLPGTLPSQISHFFSHEILNRINAAKELRQPVPETKPIPDEEVEQ